MMLPRGLKRGAWMELDAADIRALAKASGGGDRGGSSGATAQGERGAPSRTDAGGGRRRGGRGRSGGPRGSGNGQRGVPPLKQGGGVPRNEQRPPKTDRQAEAGQPDPMKTSFGYIGADSFTRQRQAPAQGRRRRGRAGAAWFRWRRRSSRSQPLIRHVPKANPSAHRLAERFSLRATGSNT